MNLFRAAAVAAIAAAPLVASAGLASVFFEKTWDRTNGDVNEYYNGGTAADGSSGGPNLGVLFVNVSGLSNDALGPYYNKGSLGSSLGVAYAQLIQAWTGRFGDGTARGEAHLLACRGAREGAAAMPSV